MQDFLPKKPQDFFEKKCGKPYRIFTKNFVTKPPFEDLKTSFPQRLRAKANKKAKMEKNENTIAKKQIL